MSGCVGRAIFESGMVANVGVAVGIASPALSVQTLFPLSVSTFGFVADILGYRCAPMPGLVGSAIPKSRVRSKAMGVAAGLALPALSVQQLFPLPISWPTLWRSGCRPM